MIKLSKNSALFFDPNWRVGSFFSKKTRDYTGGYSETEYYIGFWTLSIGRFQKYSG